MVTANAHRIRTIRAASAARTGIGIGIGSLCVSIAPDQWPGKAAAWTLHVTMTLSASTLRVPTGDARPSLSLPRGAACLR